MEYRQVDFLSNHYQGSTGFGLKYEDCYFKIPILPSGERETVTISPWKKLRIGGTICKRRKNRILRKKTRRRKIEPITIPVTKIRLKYYIDETADGIVYRHYGVSAVPTNGRIHQKNRNCFI